MNLQFSNPIYAGQDPFVCKGPDGRYYGVAESPDSRQIEVFGSDSLTDRGIRRIAFTAFDSGKCSADLWAPEIWYLRGKWYIYFAGAEGAGMPWWDTHRMFVLEADEPLGPYRFCGELELGEHMSIDGTVMELPDGRLIFIYMRKYEGENTLFMAPMSSPTKISGQPVLLSKPDHPWEADINEGAFPIVRNGKVSVLYAANAAHLPQYCLALLHCTDPENILDRSVWVKEESPILTAQKDIIGPGHACIVPSPDGSEDWLLFHSKFDDNDTLPGGWNRVINLHKLTWDEKDRPTFAPLKARGEKMPVPSGEKPLEAGTALEINPGQAADLWQEFAYYRCHTVFYEDHGLYLKGTAAPDYGDKVLLRNIWQDFRLECRILPGTGESGLLLRIDNPASGRYLWEGIGVMLSPDSWRVVSCDGKALAELASGSLPTAGEQRLRLFAHGDRLSLWACDTQLCALQIPNVPGRIGFGTLGGDGRFSHLRIDPV